MLIGEQGGDPMMAGRPGNGALGSYDKRKILSWERRDSTSPFLPEKIFLFRLHPNQHCIHRHLFAEPVIGRAFARPVGSP
jgi:hypothetical protein